MSAGLICNICQEGRMSQKIALIMALPSESKGLFEQAGIDVHYSGIGKVNAAF